MSASHPITLEGAVDLNVTEGSGLLGSWAPIFKYHPQEHFFPIDVGEYVRSSALLRMDAKLTNLARPSDKDVVVKRGHLTWSTLLSTPPGRLLPDPAFVERASRNELAHRVYGVARRLADGRVWLAYVLFYAYNPGVPVCCAALNQVGAHISDTEQVHLILDPTGNTLERVCLSAHGSRESTWYEPAEITMDSTEGTRPIVFVALNSHAHYATPGPKRRVFGVIRDLCARSTTDADSVTVDAQSCLCLMDAQHPWRSYGGMMGPRSGWSIGAAGNLDPPGPWTNTTRNALRRRLRMC